MPNGKMFHQKARRPKFIGPSGIVERKYFVSLWESPNSRETCLQLIVPKTLRNHVLKRLHDSVTSGHFGVRKTLERIKQRFYWIGCRDDVRKRYVQCSQLYIYWNDNCGSNFEANMAEIEARLVGMIQAPTRKFTQFRMKNFKNRHSFFGKSFLIFFLLCVKSGFITPPGN